MLGLPHDEPSRVLNITRAKELLEGIMIPPRPAILIDVLNAQAAPEVNLKRIADIISEDVALSAATLKVVNSPFFGLRVRIGSIHHSVRLLGVNNVVNIATGLMLRTAFSDLSGWFMDRFWASSSRLALYAALIGRTCTSIPPDELYTLGLFCNCGIPILLRRYPAYKELYTEALEQSERSVSEIEEAELMTDHTVVGYMLAQQWQLPDLLSHCILRHHDTRDYYTDAQEENRDSLQRLAVILTAQHIEHMITYQIPSFEWKMVGGAVQAFLGLDADALASLQEEALALSEGNES